MPHSYSGARAPEISVVVPLYNEVENLAPTVETIVRALSVSVEDYEVIVVDDGSTDGTDRVADALAARFSEVRVIHNPRNMGLGYGWMRAIEAASKSSFIFVPGDDTWMRSVTAYRDRFGTVTMMCTAQVLLEEHTPLALGNPCAMVTTPFPDVMDHARRLLDHLDYRGFANFDVKVDPRDGSALFLEVNPRIGRNNYYVTASGVNVARFMVADVLEHRRVEPVTADREIVYSLVPKSLLLRYVTDPGLKAHVKAVARRAYVNPLLYRVEGVRRRLYVALNKANHVAKFLRHYPRPTESGF